MSNPGELAPRQRDPARNGGAVDDDGVVCLLALVRQEKEQGVSTTLGPRRVYASIKGSLSKRDHTVDDDAGPVGRCIMANICMKPPSIETCHMVDNDDVCPQRALTTRIGAGAWVHRV